MLELRGLRVSYGTIEALHGVDLEVREGETVAVVGPNGAGKTTMVNAICGLVPASAGEIAFRGRQLRGTRPERIARAGVSLVPEGRRIFGTLTVRENMLLTMPRGAGADPDEVIGRMVERFAVLGRYLDAPAGGLSGGEQQQLAIARALVPSPDLLILDEPSLGLAPKIIEDLFEQLEALRAEGLTILLVEQKAASAVHMADRTHVLRNGTVAITAERGEFADNRELVSSYLGVRRGDSAPPGKESK